MKFKTKEELIDELTEGKGGNRDYKVGYEVGINLGINQVFKSFAERVEFYKKYRHERFAFKEAYPEAYLEFEKSRWPFFDLWLFDYCFGDVK